MDDDNFEYLLSMSDLQIIKGLTRLMDCEPEVATQCASLMVEWITETLTDRGWLLIADFGLFEIHNHKEYIFLQELALFS